MFVLLIIIPRATLAFYYSKYQFARLAFFRQKRAINFIMHRLRIINYLHLTEMKYLFLILFYVYEHSWMEDYYNTKLNVNFKRV